MEKKLTKAEIKERETKQIALRNERRYFVDAVKGFWKDVDSAHRYLATKNEGLSDEEQERLFRNYAKLNDYKLAYDRNDPEYNMWTIIRLIVNNDRRENDEYLTTKLDKDDLYINDILWDLNEVKLLIKEARKYGFKNLFYMNNSSGAMEVIGLLLSLGAKIIKPVYDAYNERYGLIINIEECDLIDFIDDQEIVDGIRNELEFAGKKIVHDFIFRDIKNKLILKYENECNITSLITEINNIRQEIIKRQGR